MLSVFVLERLTNEDISTILARALERHNGHLSSEGPDASQSASPQTPAPVSSVALTETLSNTIVSLAGGDARTALSLLELVITSLSLPPTRRSSEAALVQSLKKSVATSYDRSGDDRYDLISALHKSVRGSDGSAALYWLARCVTGSSPQDAADACAAECSPVARTRCTSRGG